MPCWITFGPKMIAKVDRQQVLGVWPRNGKKDLFGDYPDLKNLMFYGGLPAGGLPCTHVLSPPPPSSQVPNFPSSWPPGSQFPKFPISNCKSLPSFNFSDNSNLLRSLTIGGDPSDPFRSLRSLRSVPIPLIRVISSTHTLPVSVLSLPSHASHCEDKFHQRRALGDARRNLSIEKIQSPEKLGII